MAELNIDDLIATAASTAARVEVVTARPTARLLSDDNPCPKLLAIGDYATGKTEFLLGPLLAGERLWVVETDNGSGLTTIRAMLDPALGNPRCLNRTDLLRNVYSVVIPSYKHFLEFLRTPALYFPDLAAFDPTVSVWEGLANFQTNYIDAEILKDEEQDPTEASLDIEDKFEYYRKLKRATLRAVNLFLLLGGPRGYLPKIVTVLRNTEYKSEGTGKATHRVARTDLFTGEKRPAALLAGSAESHLMPAFDVIFAAEKEAPVSDDPLDTTVYPPEYRYRFVKNRYGNTGDATPADPSALWTAVGGSRA
jgi:hypothetical protein